MFLGCSQAPRTAIRSRPGLVRLSPTPISAADRPSHATSSVLLQHPHSIAVRIRVDSLSARPGGGPRRPSGPLQFLLSSCEHPGPPSTRRRSPTVWCRIRSGAAHLFHTSDTEALSAVPTAQGIIRATPAVAGEGRVRGRPSLQYNSPLRPQGPAATRGLHLSFSSNALLCPRTQGGQLATAATPKRGSSPGLPPSTVQPAAAAPGTRRVLRPSSSSGASLCSSLLLRPHARRAPGPLLKSLRQSGRGRQLQAPPLPAWTGTPAGRRWIC
ncbi:hypothetical protein NDU88_000164 [Pleurodeles waltl]|uniref:Uncharacterized protein n=1 Tax=Pleurodeles waltl TaxID=8319 RepID=A0AAV7LU24_PLEWA|nr:hypothetical protein NDU88_000164 [Pleurodeles waltl]